MPVLGHELAEPVNGIRHRQRREDDREPAIRSAQQDGTRLLRAWLPVVDAQVGMAATTTGQRVLPLLAKSLRHAPLLAASLTEDLDIRCLARYSQFAQFKASLARYFSVHEVDPGKIVEVPVFTGGQETRRNHRRRCARRGTVHLHIGRLIWPVEIGP